MENKVKVVQFGTGKMAKYTMRYVYEKGGEVVGAIDVNPAVIGKDIGEIIGCENKNVKVTSFEDAEAMLKEVKPDICVVETMSLIKDLEDPFMLCAKLGINAISTCEEAFFPWNSNPNLTKKIDELAKQTGCTITGSGYQDIYWGQLITSIAGSTQKITKIKGSTSYNVEDYGIALANAHGAGLTLDEFDKQVAIVDKISDEERNKIIQSGDYLPSYMWNTNGWLCEKLGLTIKSQTQVTVPTTNKEDIYSSTLGMTVKAGDATGMSAVVTTETEEGITIESDKENKQMTVKLDANYDSKDLLDIELFNDSKNKKTYLYAKDLLDAYLEVPIDNYSEIEDSYTATNMFMAKDEESAEKIKTIINNELIKVIKEEYCSKQSEGLNNIYVFKINEVQLAQEIKSIVTNLKSNNEFISCYEDANAVKESLENIITGIDESECVESNVITEFLLSVIWSSEDTVPHMIFASFPTIS